MPKNSIEQYTEEYKDELKFLSYTKPNNKKDTYDIVFASKNQPDLPQKVKRHGTRYRKYRDIPFKERKVWLKVGKETYFNLETEKRIPITSLNCMVENHSITKRLANYVLQEMCYKKYNDISSETGISRRLLYTLWDEWNERVSKTYKMEKLYIFPIEVNQSQKYVILENRMNAVKIVKDKTELKDYLLTTSYKEVTLPADIELCLQIRFKTKAKVNVEVSDFNAFITKSVLKAYVTEREKIESEEKRRKTKSIFSWNLDREKDLFIKPPYSLSQNERLDLECIRTSNSIFNNFYVYKERLLQKAASSLMETNKEYIEAKLYYMNFRQNTDDSFELKEFIYSSKITELLGVIELFKEKGIRLIDYPGLSSDVSFRFQKDYDELHKILSDKQFILRWNNDRKYI